MTSPLHLVETLRRLIEKLEDDRALFEAEKRAHEADVSLLAERRRSLEAERAAFLELMARKHDTLAAERRQLDALAQAVESR